MPSETRDDHLLSDEQRAALAASMQPLLEPVQRAAGEAVRARAQEIASRLQRVAPQAGVASVRTVLGRFAERFTRALGRVEQLRRAAAALERRRAAFNQRPRAPGRE